MAGDIPGQNTQISMDDFVPIVGKNYIQPHLVQIEAGAYKDFKYPRSVLLIPKSPTTTGIVYIYPGAFPVNDLASIPIPAGQLVYLDARGEWYVKTSSAVTETFLVIDGGAAANAQAVAALLGGGATPAPSAIRTPAAGAVATVGIASGQVIAASATRKYLYVKNVSTAGQRITLEFAGAAVLDTGHTLNVGEWRVWDASSGIFQTAMTAIASAASASLEYVTGT